MLISAASNFQAQKNRRRRKKTETQENTTSQQGSSTGTQSSEAKATSGNKSGFLSPAVALLIARNSMDAGSIKATGPKGLLLKGDVLKALENGEFQTKEASSTTTASQASASSASGTQAVKGSSSVPSGRRGRRNGVASYTDIPVTNGRKVIAKNTVSSKYDVPHYYLTSQVKMDNVLALRKKWNAEKEAAGQDKVSINDILTAAVAKTLKKHPVVNSSWDGPNMVIREFKHADISIAMASEKGLIMPIVKKADTKSISQIAKEVRELAEKANQGTLALDEFQGGTFAISNLGMKDIRRFTAVLPQPQAAILAVGNITPVVSNIEEVVEGTEVEGEYDVQFEVDTNMVMDLTLSCDHRVIDGAVGAEFMRDLKKGLENVEYILL
eukprot:TRINITY_DN14158_c0_g2_i1.p1 TRINITY_DN14158_c0_g2~~TRINITY_DN14158_c0_g2_i1.p1  ORF type:complete len:384 (+),score=132.69 TRINITY_DN14158_c0_g2_i1:508-1659(+)